MLLVVPTDVKLCKIYAENIIVYYDSENIFVWFVWFDLICLHQQTGSRLALYRLDKNGKLLKFFAYPNDSHVFQGPEMNL